MGQCFSFFVHCISLYFTLSLFGSTLFIVLNGFGVWDVYVFAQRTDATNRFVFLLRFGLKLILKLILKLFVVVVVCQHKTVCPIPAQFK